MKLNTIAIITIINFTGGVGPMTVAMLMRNTFIAAKKLAETRKQKKLNK
jgi:5,10-methylene-tetrahydrofolate dehydrogenase/methenyl tetrahydrofolate cyclohydrolase